jgi:4'-phosphopantetheinyl transferase
MGTPADGSEPRRLGDGRVDVWRVSLDGDADGATLSPAERVRADRRSGNDRDRFVASHTATRAIVAGYTGDLPGELRLEAPYGERPHVAGGEVAFSLAHSGQLALVAVAQSAIGVDLERVEELPDGEVDDLAEFSLCERELAELAALEPHLRRRAFLCAWTRKEACLKLVGKGLGDRLMAEIDVGGRGPRRRVELPGETVGAVTVVDLEPAPGFVGAVAVAANNVVVALHDWTPTATGSATVGKPDNVVS